jgi:hypothetical protein
MYVVKCSACGKNFDFNPKVNSNLANAVGRDSEKSCYSCTLASLTGGRAPEEGDFNSASLISGEISDKELGWLMEDLRAVETGRSVREPYEEADEETSSIWDDRCPKCDEYLDVCECGYVQRCSHCHEPAIQCLCNKDDEI